MLHDSGTLIDAIPYGDFYGLSAENPYIYDTLLAGRSLKTVRRESYSSGPFTGGEFARDEVTTGDANPGIEPKPSLKPASGRYTLNRGRKVYERKNHLGNVLAVVSDVKIGVGPAVQPSVVEYYEADVIEMTDYELPQRAGSSTFGMPLSRRRWVNGEKYRFGFNGKEKDDEINGEGNSLSALFWQYDPRLGRRWNRDPLAAKYPFQSPYCAFDNNPIILTDPTGLATEHDYGIDKNGKRTLIKRTDDKFDRLYAMDENGIMKDERNYVQVFDQSLLPELNKLREEIKLINAGGDVIERGELHFASSDSKEDVVNLFAFLGKTTVFEIVVYSTVDERYHIGTLGLSGQSPTPARMELNKEKVVAMVHSHVGQKAKSEEIDELYGDKAVSSYYPNIDYYTYQSFSTNLYLIHKDGTYLDKGKADAKALLKVLK